MSIPLSMYYKYPYARNETILIIVVKSCKEERNKNLTLHLIGQFWGLSVQQQKGYHDDKNMDKWVSNYLIEWKTLWEKEKLLVTSNFSFSHNVFKGCLLLMLQTSIGAMFIFYLVLGWILFFDSKYTNILPLAN